MSIQYSISQGYICMPSGLYRAYDAVFIGTSTTDNDLLGSTLHGNYRKEKELNGIGEASRLSTESGPEYCVVTQLNDWR